MYYIEPNQDYRTQSTHDDSAEELREAAVKHYDACYRDYLFAWSGRDDLALHYGYWDENTRSHSESLLNKNQKLYEAADIKPSDYVLDAGCGIGGSSIWMAKNHANHLKAITISAKQAYYAGRHAKRHGVAENIDFEVSDFCATPYADETFDIVWGLESVCHALNKADFIREAFRILKKGGRLVVCDGFLMQREIADEDWPAMVDCLDGWAVPNLCLRKEFAQLLIDQGFSNIKYDDITEQTLPSADYMYKVAKRLQPVQKISQWLGLRSETQTANFKVGLAQHHLFHNNLVEYGIFSAEKL
ncbi:methyltransferase type 11 [Methyloprofundus sedimenti]|uniref:Methyltransferase type 11 n=1 Tax=Methyloprofundus sedimenti TaxID=1420851 RepID=A0A1V8M4E4_9GAMM|nr:methyltransferase domain-containing protein [Methyloprofundus sedimenti]OQK16388.1 methyltransferase type 11 [Methyloprofundus sedimenti]